MVYNGPSKGCRACRKRRVKCDQGKPACNNCTKRKVECPGYESTFDYRHRNETNSTIMRVQQRGETTRRKSASDALESIAANGSSTTLLSDNTERLLEKSSNDLVVMLAHPEVPKIDVPFDVLDPDPEMLVLNWYFTNYPMKCVDPQSSHGFVPLLKPIYLASPVDSPLRPAVAAIASNLLMLFCHQGSDSDLARKFYAKSVTQMKKKITDPDRSKEDDIILTTLALNFYDMINLRFSNDPSNFENHREGALALFKHRGSSNSQTDVSRHITSCIRTALCRWALDSDKPISPDVLQWITDTTVPVNKACELDMIILKLIDYQQSFKRFYQLHKMGQVFEGTNTKVQHMVDEGLKVDQMFRDWAEKLPSHWFPLFADAKNVLPSLREAGLYGDRCAVYWDLSVCDSWNTCRQRRLTLLRMIRQLCIDKPDPQFIATLASVEATMQKLLDEQCEAIPFMLGDVTTTIRHSQLYEINYPTATNGICTFPNVDHDHPRAAAGSGGWLGSAQLASIAKMAVKDGCMDPFTMRPGQFEWVYGQLGRVQRVFLLSQPANRANWQKLTRF